MSVYQSKSGTWFYKFIISGKQYHKSVPEATSMRDAEKAETILKAQILQGKYDLAEGKGEMFFDKLVAVFVKYGEINRIGWHNDKYTVEEIKNFFSGKKLKDITPFMIEKYRLYRRNKGIANATINRNVSIISKMFNIAIDNGWTNDNPCTAKKVKPLRVENKVERFLFPEEEEALINSCIKEDTYLRPIIITLLHTAMRKGECLSLKWSENIDFKQKSITLYKTKSGKMRRIPMSNTVYNELIKLYNNRKSDYVFTNPITNNRYENIKKGFKRVCERAGIKNLTPHCLRHSAATKMVFAGIDLAVVQEILGHADIATTMRYSHPVPERKVQAIQALDNLSNNYLSAVK